MQVCSPPHAWHRPRLFHLPSSTPNLILCTTPAGRVPFRKTGFTDGGSRAIAIGRRHTQLHYDRGTESAGAGIYPRGHPLHRYWRLFPLTTHKRKAKAVRCLEASISSLGKPETSSSSELRMEAHKKTDFDTDKTSLHTRYPRQYDGEKYL